MNDISVIKEKFQYLDILRILATIFVILLHCLTPVITDIEIYSTKTWWFCLFANAVTRTGVPLFFMISGYLLLNSSKTLKIVDFYKKRFTRILIPFLVWNVIYFIYFKMLQGDKKPVDFFKELFVRGSSYHFWFVYTLIGIYMFIPFLKRMVDSCSNKQLIWLLAIITFTGTTRPFINTITPFYIYLFDPLTEGYLGYVILGYILGKINIDKKVRIFIYTGGFAGLLISMIGNHSFSSYDMIKLNFNGGYQINHFLCAAAIFVFVKHLKPLKNSKLNALITEVSSVTYAMYLIHVLVLDILNKHFVIARPIYNIFFMFSISFTICLFIMLLASRIKFLNKVLM